MVVSPSPARAACASTCQKGVACQQLTTPNDVDFGPSSAHEHGRKLAGVVSEDVDDKDGECVTEDEE